MKPIHNVLRLIYSGTANAIITEAGLTNPLTNRSINLTKVLWDTGASTTCVNQSAAAALGLIPTGQTISHTANGKALSNTYIAHLILPNSVAFQALNITEGNLGPDVELLVGMDVIGAGDFTIQNQNGRTHFSYCAPPFDNKYDMYEKAIKLNPQIHKQNVKNGFVKN